MSGTGTGIFVHPDFMGTSLTDFIPPHSPVPPGSSDVPAVTRTSTGTATFCTPRFYGNFPDSNFSPSHSPLHGKCMQVSTFQHQSWMIPVFGCQVLLVLPCLTPQRRKTISLCTWTRRNTGRRWKSVTKKYAKRLQLWKELQRYSAILWMQTMLSYLGISCKPWMVTRISVSLFCLWQWSMLCYLVFSSLFVGGGGEQVLQMTVAVLFCIDRHGLPDRLHWFNATLD